MENCSSIYPYKTARNHIIELDDEDNLLHRMINSYTNGLKAQKNGDPVSAYKCFYLVFPEGTAITDDEGLKLDLKLFRDGASHTELKNKNLMDRAKELLGNEFVVTKGDKRYAHIDMTKSEHIELYNRYLQKLKTLAREHIDDYIKSH